MARERILVVDDEPRIVELCKRVLNTAGFETKGVLDGKEAIELAKEETFDLILVDINMPGISGLDVVEYIRKIDPEIAAVIITGHGNINTAIDSLKSGAQGFVMKPFSLNELVTSVEEAIQKNNLVKENTRLKALLPLFQISKVLVDSTERGELFELILKIAQRETGADRASLRLFNEQTGKWETKAAINPIGDGIVGEEEEIFDWIVKNVEPLLITIEQDSRFREIISKLGMSSAVYLPLAVRGKTIEVLNLSKSKDERPFSKSDLRLLSILGEQAAVAIENVRLFSQIQGDMEKLRKLDDLRSEFLNLAGHELLTPLTSILAYTEMIKDERVGELNSKQLEFMETIYQSSQRLMKIVKDLLDMSELEMGQMILDINAEAIDYSIKEAIKEVMPDAELKSLSLSSHISEGLPMVKVDAKRVRQIFHNLLNNAIKFTPPEGKITVRAELDGDKVLVSISDTGPGIAEEVREKIFKEFSLGENHLRRQQGGVGLGLTIAKRLVQLHGGEVWVDSEPGEGSTFYFTLPPLE